MVLSAINGSGTAWIINGAVLKQHFLLFGLWIVYCNTAFIIYEPFIISEAGVTLAYARISLSQFIICII